VEIEPRRAELAAHNARIYGVEDRIRFVVGDFYRLAPFLKVPPEPPRSLSSSPTHR